MQSNISTIFPLEWSPGIRILINKCYRISEFLLIFSILTLILAVLPYFFEWLSMALSKNGNVAAKNRPLWYDVLQFLYMALSLVSIVYYCKFFRVCRKALQTENQHLLEHSVKYLFRAVVLFLTELLVGLPIVGFATFRYYQFYFQQS